MADTNGLKDALKKLSERLQEVVSDVTTLSVRTFRGGVAAKFDGKKWTVEKDATSELLAMTEVSLDGDVDLFLPMKNGAVDPTLLEYHQKAVKDGAEARAAVLKGVVDVLNVLK